MPQCRNNTHMVTVVQTSPRSSRSPGRVEFRSPGRTCDAVGSPDCCHSFWHAFSEKCQKRRHAVRNQIDLFSPH